MAEQETPSRDGSATRALQGAGSEPPDGGTMPSSMMRLIRAQRLGLVATVNADGTPNLSPKGSFVVVDAARVAFGDIRSPGTLRNLAARPAVDVNFVDPFARRGCRLSGTARAIRRGEPEFDRLIPLFAHYGPLVPRMTAVVLIDVVRALSLRSPSYDDGTSEGELRQIWLDHFRALQPGGDFMA